MNTNSLLNELRALEIELHQPEARFNATRLDELLHESFCEFGRSGTVYGRKDIIRELPSGQSTTVVWSQDFELHEVAEGVALLTYKSAHVDDAGSLCRYSLRSSLWQKSHKGWQMRFHQGTSVSEFKRRSN